MTKRCLTVILMFLLSLIISIGCRTMDDSVESYTWDEGYIYLVQNENQYDWVIQQTNVLVAFVDSENDKANSLLAAEVVMEDKLPWLWLAKVEVDEAPEVFEAAGVEITPTLKFFSYGVKMDELTLAGEVTEEQIVINTQILIDRYEPDVFKATTVEELETMLADPTNPILVKFGATWCAPCQRMIPRLELASIEYGDELQNADGNFVRDEKLLIIIEVDVDEVPGMGTEYGFEAIPFFIFYNDGVRYGDMLGEQHYEKLTVEIDDFLANFSE